MLDDVVDEASRLPGHEARGCGDVDLRRLDPPVRQHSLEPAAPHVALDVDQAGRSHASHHQHSATTATVVMIRVEPIAIPRLRWVRRRSMRGL